MIFLRLVSEWLSVYWGWFVLWLVLFLLSIVCCWFLLGFVFGCFNLDVLVWSGVLCL